MNQILRIGVAMALVSSAVPLTARSQPDSDNAVGSITCSAEGQSWRTVATLVINSHTVLSVAHHSQMQVGKRIISATDCRFDLFRSNGSRYYSSKVHLIDRGGDVRLQNISRSVDWAILRLETPAPREVAPLSLGLNSLANEPKKIRIAGFIDGHPRRGRKQLECTAQRIQRGSILISYECATAPGWSGAPVLSADGDDIRVLGIHAAREPHRGIGLSLAGALGEAVKAGALAQPGESAFSPSIAVATPAPNTPSTAPTP